MITTARSGLWTCSTCLRRCALRQARSTVPKPARQLSLATNTAIASDAASKPVSHTPPGAHHDDTLLRQIFDSPPTFKHFARPWAQLTGPPNVGLFRNKYLTSPQGFLTFAEVTVHKAQGLVEKVLAA
ncbi:hypothetical protein Micbo1qcDRAFT_157394, partial [Microdochium bolleyi]